MSSCARNRWGKGTTCEKPIVTPATEELDKKIKERLAERARQENFWSTPPDNDKVQTPAQPSQQLRFGN